MSAAWDRKTVDFVLGLPHQGTVTMEWVLGILMLRHRQETYYSFQRGMPIDIARNKICDKVIELKAQGVFFLDTDVVAPPDAIERLRGHNLPLVSGIYYRKQSHDGVYTPAMWARAPPGLKGGKFTPIAEFPKGRLVDVEVVGMGCCWISRRLLEEWIKCETCGQLMAWTDEHGERMYFCQECKTEPRRIWWFYWSKERTEAPEDGMSEDFYFCQEAKRRGYKILVDTSVACKHIGFFSVEDGHVREAQV